MKSFPSTFNRGGNNAVSRGKASSENIRSSSIGSDILSRISAKNLTKNTLVKQYLFSDTDVTNYDRRIKLINVHKNKSLPSSNVVFENPNFMSSKVLDSINTYQWIFKEHIKSLYDIRAATKEERKMNNFGTESTQQSTQTSTSNNANGGSDTSASTAKAEDNGEPSIPTMIDVTNFKSCPSLFNPQYGVMAVGFTNNIPLLLNYDIKGKGASQRRTNDPTNCNIERLVNDSLKKQSPLGQARYRLIDFLYCKDLGKVSNNHLITLRKFPFPIGDHIFEYSGPKYAGKEMASDTPGDLGRLISWFGTDDNKLEDICKYEVQSTWKQMESKIQEIHTDKENSENRGIIGMLGNSANARYASYALRTGDGGNDIFTHFIGNKMSKIFKGTNNDNNDAFRYVDQNKVWTPKNTIWDNNYPEGRLIMKQEFTLNFSYKLRAYENINPRAAMLDLIGNILETTYSRGTFWGGSVRSFGPPGNGSAYRKANSIINNAWERLGGFMKGLAAGTIDFEQVLGSLSSLVEAAGNAVGDITNAAKDVISNGSIGQVLGQGLLKINKTFNLSTFAKGALMNKLGRPAMYAMDSLVSGDNFGPWHLTVGNPYNPIMAIGNLILTNATITHSGALGVDDFPTEIKVTCNLKAARSRDLEGISKYYTKGMSPIYMPTAHNKSTDLYKAISAGKGMESPEKAMAKMKQQQEEINNSIKDFETAQNNIAGSYADDKYLQAELGHTDEKLTPEQVNALYPDSNGWEYKNDISNSMLLNTVESVKCAMLGGYSLMQSVVGKDQYA